MYVPTQAGRSFSAYSPTVLLRVALGGFQTHPARAVSIFKRPAEAYTRASYERCRLPSLAGLATESTTLYLLRGHRAAPGVAQKTGADPRLSHMRCLLLCDLLFLTSITIDSTTLRSLRGLRATPGAKGIELQETGVIIPRVFTPALFLALQPTAAYSV